MDNTALISIASIILCIACLAIVPIGGLAFKRHLALRGYKLAYRKL
jgi:hypothetical protein